MKKSLPIAAVCIALSLQANSQKIFDNARVIRKFNNGSSAAKTTGPYERVIGTRGYSFFGGMYQNNDSARVFYSNGRGHDADYAEIKFDELIYQDWDATIQAWDTTSRERQTFDANNNVTSLTSDEENFITDILEPAYKELYSYNANGKITATIYQDWDASANTYINDTKDSTVYTAGNLKQFFLSYEWNGSSWDLTNRITYTHTGSLLTSYIFEYYDGINWINDLKIIHSYDGAGNLTGYEFLGWNASSAQWIPSYRTTFTLGTSAQTLSSLAEQWNSNTNSYQNQSRTTSTYDANLDNIELISEDWNTTTNTWDKVSKTVQAFNSYHMLRMSENLLWDAASSNWLAKDGSYKAFYWFESYTASTKNVAGLQGVLTVFPTIATSDIHVQIINGGSQRVTATVYDMQGRNVMQWTDNTSGTYHKTVDVSQLAAGAYNLTIRTATGVETKKFIVK